MKGMTEFPIPLGRMETIGVIFFIMLVYYGLFMGGLHTLLTSLVVLDDPEVVWFSEGGLWDHPEPNYKVLPFVAEFYSSGTAVPLAGGLLLYQALRFSYNTPVLILFLLDCWMYTCAFFSHMFLWPVLNSITLTSVLTNAIYTFVVYAGLAGGIFKHGFMRIILAISLWLCVVYLVLVLPAWFGQNGGVPALLTIQTPAVFCALAGAVYCKRTHSNEKDSRVAFRLLITSGIILSCAMGVSLIEVLYGKKVHKHFTGIVPVLHMTIHILEQIGIYLYGVGVAIIEHSFIHHVHFARVEYVWGCLPYLAMSVPLTEYVDIRKLPEEIIEAVAAPTTPARRSGRLAKKDL